jgi:putative oxidoreductase
VNVALWVVQVLLGLFSVAAGWNHGLRPLNETIQSSPSAADLPAALVQFIGFAELAPGVGLVLPAATRVMERDATCRYQVGDHHGAGDPVPHHAR